MKKILFNRESAIAYREGRKCRTQRVLSPQPSESIDNIRFDEDFDSWVDEAFDFIKKRKCPYGQAGDCLQLLTSWAVDENYDNVKPSRLYKYVTAYSTWTAFDSKNKPDYFGRIRSPLHMPGWLRAEMPHPKILSIEARRLREITDVESIEEGVTKKEFVRRNGESVVGYCYDWSRLGQLSRFAGGIFPRNEKYPLKEEDICLESARMAYANTWDSNNAKRGYPWKLNPWVWNIEIEKFGGRSGYEYKKKRLDQRATGSQEMRREPLPSNGVPRI